MSASSLKLADIEAARLAPDAPEAQALVLKLEEATRLLREGHKKMDECDTKLAILRLSSADEHPRGRPGAD
jgi:hypothetical protein